MFIMAIRKGLYGEIEGLEALANEPITGVQAPHSEFGSQTIVSQDLAEFKTVGEFVSMVESSGLAPNFQDADNASIDPNTGILTLGKNVGSNG